MKPLYRALLLLTLIAVVFVLVPWQWYPRDWRVWYADTFGASGYQTPLSTRPAVPSEDAEEACPPDIKGWRKAQSIAGVEIGQSPNCLADNPHAVAAFVKGTNNVGHMTLMDAKLSPDAVVKGRDLDGDGDPDEIHIRLEVFELNGGSPDLNEPVVQYSIAPGIKPGLWVFAPKSLGMSTENFESLVAQPGLRLPSPAIRVEQGDHVKVTLENTHYMPHTIHFHGVDHPFLTADGGGNDGVPMTSEKPVMPGKQRTYEMQPRQPGTMFYHCHVEVQAHLMMGLNGLFVIEENRPNNWVQTMNIGDGLVRHSSVAVKEKYDREYDLHYQDIDEELGATIQGDNDPRVITQKIHREYDIGKADPDYHTLNGRSFPYTARDSLIVTAPDELVKLRVVNGGSAGVAIHTHGHKVTISHHDGVEYPEPVRVTRDVVWIASAQRVDLELSTKDDGLHSYGEGVWLLHDHEEKGVVTNGFGPGGNVSAIVYERYLQDNGWPMTFGLDWTNYLTPGFYDRRNSDTALLPGVEEASGVSLRIIALVVLAGIFIGLIIVWFYPGKRRGKD
ncbi:MAG: multicopper oxidase domain-containing protein [Porticoccaceae bacterium]|nr:multicopper oxidase domain-containing protein [Porticoccaceae bacterium]